MFKVTNLMSSTPRPYISISTHYLVLIVDEAEPRVRRLKGSMNTYLQKLWMFYRLFSTNIFIADGLASHS